MLRAVPRFLGEVLILSSICLWNLHSAFGTFISPLGTQRSAAVGKAAVAPFSEDALLDLISLHSLGRRLDKRLPLPDLPALSLPIYLRRLRGGKGFEDGVDDGNTNRGNVGKNIFFCPLREVARDGAEEEPGDGGNTSGARVVDSCTINLNKAEGSPIFPDNKVESESTRERESARATATVTERNKATVCETAKGAETDTKQKMERKERRHRQVKTRADKESSFSTESERGGQKIEKKGGSDARVRNEAPLHEGAKGLGRDRSTERERGEGRKTIKKRESDARVRHAAPLREGAKGRCDGASRIVVALQLLLHPLRVALVRAWAAANRIHELTHVSGLPGPRALLGLVQRLYYSFRSLLLVIFNTPLGCVSTLLEVMLKLRWVLVPLAIQMLMQALCDTAEDALEYASCVYREARQQGDTRAVAAWYSAATFVHAFFMLALSPFASQDAGVAEDVVAQGAAYPTHQGPGGGEHTTRMTGLTLSDFLEKEQGHNIE